MLKNAETYEIMRPEDVGQGGSNLVMGKHSGRHAFREKLKALGYDLGQNALNEAFGRFKDLADKKKHVFDDDIIALVDDALARGAERIQVKALRVIAGTEGPQEAHADRWSSTASRSSATATGDGPVDAVFNAIREVVAARRGAAPLPGARGDRGHRRPGPGLGAAGGGRPHRHRPGRRHRHPHRQRHGLRQRAQQPLGAARKSPPPEPIVASGF